MTPISCIYLSWESGSADSAVAAVTQCRSLMGNYLAAVQMETELNSLCLFSLLCGARGILMAWGKAGWGVYVWKPWLLGSCPGLDISDHILSFPPWPVFNKLTVINSVCLWNSLGLPVLTSTVGMGLLWNLSCFTATVQLGSRRHEHWAALVPPLGTWENKRQGSFFSPPV